MPPDEYNWNINLVRDRYHAYDLSFEQAEQVYRYEQEKATHSGKHYFSEWEEWDYEWTVFSEIFNEDQFRKYNEYHQENVRRYEVSLAELDKEKINEIACLEEQIHFYQALILPDFFKDPYLGFGFLLDDREKVQYLRAEYQRFLNNAKKEILTSHFRHYRTFKPNELKAALMRHKLACIIPAYGSFKHQMDEPVKAVAQYLISKLRYLPDRLKELYRRKFDELRAFNKSLYEKYYPERNGGWHAVVGQQTGEEEKEYQMMILVLLDKKMYGLE